MRATLGITLTAALLALGLLGVAFRAAQARHALESRQVAAKARHASLRAASLRLPQNPGSAETKPPARVAPASAATPVGPPLESAFPPRLRPPGLMDFARGNPQLWNAFIQSKRAELGRLHLPLLQRLHLSPAQQERFKDILAAAVARASDLGAAADAQGLAFGDPAIAALREESERRRKRELTELFGPARFKEFEDYERVLPLRGYVDGLAVEVAAHAPLSALQADRLERALAAANEPYGHGQPANPAAVDWPKVDRMAHEILSPDQFAVWQLGLAHNPFGGSRRAQELQAVYQRAVQRMKDRASANP